MPILCFTPPQTTSPQLASEVDVGSIRNIMRAISAQPNPDAIKLGSVGSVAMTGSRLPPLHWGRVGDPVAPAIGDHNAVSKIEAELTPEFWRHVYNTGGGETCRVGYISYFDGIFSVLGLGTLAELTERKWFALRNFHCQWYLDSDQPEQHLNFRETALMSTSPT